MVGPSDSNDRIAQAAAEGGDPLVQIVSFDFDNKVLGRHAPDQVRAVMAEHFCWIDVDIADEDAARKVLAQMDLCVPEIVEDALTREPATQIARYDDYLHLVLSGCRMIGHKFDLERVDVVMGEHFMLTLHRGQPVFLENVRRAYRADFMRFAQSPSFLLYELWDHLIDNYLDIHKAFEDRVEEVQAALIGDVDESVFGESSELSSDLLHLRKVVLPARAVLTELSTRKSPFVSEATQPFLGNMVGTVERVLQDVLVDRDILSSALNNYMTMVSHQTGKVMNRLTVVSVIFLPLTFLCGIWGMNFESMPELHYKHGYALFWTLVFVVGGGLAWLMRRNKLL
ncbi:MAG: magnesium transporter CorA family protein [Kofleriaceae bacterium]|nr:magnesium transporter CorA family protein [Myxococcales bacterium]MCB9559942.1 magnesium transporter CorA family protein [Kofleriaceae bacterium]MCB9571557.1 magnesium transporter CorA family protein [Kofleriaceae bacterium]